MVRIDFSVGIYEEYLAGILRWYSWNKNPSPEDQKIYNIFRVFYEDLVRENKEENDNNRDD